MKNNSLQEMWFISKSNTTQRRTSIEAIFFNLDWCYGNFNFWREVDSLKHRFLIFTRESDKKISVKEEHWSKQKSSGISMSKEDQFLIFCALLKTSRSISDVSVDFWKQILKILSYSEDQKLPIEIVAEGMISFWRALHPKKHWSSILVIESGISTLSHSEHHISIENLTLWLYLKYVLI
jgi:hypothetical protein